MNLRDAVETLREASGAEGVSGAELAARHILAAFSSERLALHFAGHRLLELGSYELAAACLEAALALGPSAEAWNDLGVTRQRLGNLNRAIEAYRSAVATQADFAPALGNLATALFLIGSYAEALPYATAAAERMPDAPAVATTVALIEGVVHGHEAALARIEATLARAPDDVAALGAQIYTLRRLERSADALAPAERLRRIAPDGRSDELLATCLRDLGRYPEALAAFDAAIARSPTPASALANKAEALMDLGDLAGARELAERAVATDPQSVAGWCVLTQLRPAHPGDAQLDVMEALLHAPHVAMREDRVLLHFALGRAHLSAGNDERAFEHFARGNRLQREAIVYDVADDEVRAEAIVALLDAPALARLAPGGLAGPDPIFIVGMPRSGTSLIEQILASVPGVYGAGELSIARTVIEADGPYPRSVPSLQPADIARLGANYAERVAQRAPPGTRIVDKMPSNYLYAGLLHAMLPDARIVLCTRDRFDVAFSLYTRIFSGRQNFAYDLREIARYARAYERVVAHWRRVLPPHAFYEVRYEDVVADFEPTVRALLAFCGLPWSEACRQFHATPRVVATASRTEVRQPLYRSSIGRAQRYAPYFQPLLEESASGKNGT